MTAEQTANVEKMKAAIETLKAAGEELFKSQIAEIQASIDEIEKSVETEVATVKETIIQKYGQKVWEAAKAIAIVFIVYKLF